jgi:hypothetical protein
MLTKYLSHSIQNSRNISFSIRVVDLKDPYIKRSILQKNFGKTYYNFCGTSGSIIFQIRFHANDIWVIRCVPSSRVS